MYPATGIPVFNLTILANSTYLITWGANDQNMTMGSATYYSAGAGSKTVVYTGANTNMAFIGTANGTLVTVVLQLAPKAIPVPGDFTWASEATFTNVVASWDAPPVGVTQTELWTSTDNITFALNQTIAAPGTTANVAVPAIGTTLYAKVRWTKVINGTFGTTLQFTRTTWETRVTGNGGIATTALEKSVQNNFYSAMANVGILSQMIVANLYSRQQNVSNFATPILQGTGASKWAVTGFSNTDTGVNGLTGNGVNSSLAIGNGLGASTIWSADGNMGVTLYLSIAGSEAKCDFGSQNVGNNDSGIDLQINNAGTASFTCWSFANAVTVASPGAGFYCYNRVSVTDGRMYYAKSTSPIAQVGATNIANVNGRTTDIPYFFALSFNAAPVIPSGHTHSFGALHNGLTIYQASLLFNIVQAALVAYGGGSV